MKLLLPIILAISALAALFIGLCVYFGMWIESRKWIAKSDGSPIRDGNDFYYVFSEEAAIELFKAHDRKRMAE